MPPADWPPAPNGWQLWVSDGAAKQQHTRVVVLSVLAAVVVLALLIMSAVVVLDDESSDAQKSAAPVGANIPDRGCKLTTSDIPKETLHSDYVAIASEVVQKSNKASEIPTLNWNVFCDQYSTKSRSIGGYQNQREFENFQRSISDGTTYNIYHFVGVTEHSRDGDTAVLEVQTVVQYGPTVNYDNKIDQRYTFVIERGSWRILWG